MNTKVGYARVSTTGQRLEVQLDALAAEGCEEVFQEKESGKTADNREQLKAAMKYVRKGDTLVVTKLDRLARSLTDLWTIVTQLSQKGVGLKVIDQPLIDTSKPEGKLVLTMFGYVAETERSLILERTEEGRRKAKDRGVKFGRRPKLTSAKSAAAVAEFKEGQLSAAEVGKKYGISRALMYRLAAQGTKG